MENTTEKSLLGRAKFGGNSKLLVAICLAIGLPIALLLAWGIFILGEPNMNWVGGLVATLMFWPITSILPWIFLVDIASLKNIPKNREQSVESQWVSTATSISFYIVLLALGVGGLLSLTFGWYFKTSNVLSIYTALSMLSFFISYQFCKRSDR